jgi:integrase
MRASRVRDDEGELASMAQTPGITTRHNRTCASRSGGRCNCDPSYEAWVYSKRDKKKLRRSFPTRAAARGWRTDALKAVKDKRLRAPTSQTLRQEVDEWLAGAREGRILNKRNERYKPAVLRGYESALRLRVLPALGDRKLADIDLADLLDLKEQLLGAGHSGSTIRNSFVPVQALYRRARRNGVVPINPAVDLDLPTAGRRDRAATPGQASKILNLLPELEAALWATAFYAGLRRGELRGLRVRDVDFDSAAISVEQAWDIKEGPIAPKSRAGTRTVFLLEALRPFLEPLRDRWSNQDGLFFGPSAERAFEPRAVDRKARRAIKAVNDKRQEEAAEVETQPALVEWFGFHEARHSFSTWLDAAGVSETRADRYMGHSAPGVAGRYRHLLPGQISEDAKRVDEYLAGASIGKVVSLTAAG